MLSVLQLPDRSFKLWAYTVSHGQLLLRSNPTDEHPRRWEVLFRGATSIGIPTWMDGLEVGLAAPDFAASLAAQIGEARLADREVYVLRGRHYSGHVVAASLTWTEDDGDFSTSSSLLDPSGL